MCCATAFRSSPACTCSGGPLRSEWNCFLQKWKGRWFRRTFLWWNQYLRGLVIDSLPLTAPQFWVHRLRGSPSWLTWFSTEEPVPCPRSTAHLQNHITTTLPCVPSSLYLGFFFLLILGLPLTHSRQSLRSTPTYTQSTNLSRKYQEYTMRKAQSL